MASITGQVFNIQHFSTEDGPGVRTTVFLQGCPLRCAWCANPETQKSVRQLAHRAALCVKCGCCVRSCPRGALGVRDGRIGIDREKCAACGTCVAACPSHAMFFYGERRDLDGVWAEVLRDKGYYETSGGGVTCSGGECMLQPDFVGGLFRRCREAGIHTALDTCGQFPPEHIARVLPFTDLVLYDVKTLDSEAHRRFTGVGNELILENLKRILAYPATVYIRIPVIPGYNDAPEDLRATARFVKALDPALHVDLLPYHRFGRAKYEMLDLPYPPGDLAAPTAEQKAAYLKIFTGAGLDCAIH